MPLASSPPRSPFTSTFDSVRTLASARRSRRAAHIKCDTVTRMASHPCPTCKKDAESERAKNPSWPFCSRRCKTIDLGGWLDERYRIPADEQSDGDDSTVPPRREGDGHE